ncbi:MAG TPA: MFS transporter [Verrucomicrobiales bacterium]|nr:MFS transporter [Verrucomicrobiales bacterium]
MPGHGRPTPPPQSSWLPMIVIALGQALLAFNFAALSISMGGIVASFQIPPTTVGTAIILHTLAVSAFILLGAKLGQRFGSTRFFQASTALFFVAMVLMATSGSVAVMLVAQALAGFAGAGLRPTLVVLIANHYHGRQQSEALGWLGSARAMAGALAFVLIGILERFVSWRIAFGLLVVAAGVTLLLSSTLKASPRRTDVSFDYFGVFLSAAAVLVLTLGLNQLSHWGVWRARPTAPLDILGWSPAPLMIATGLILGSAFVIWIRRRVAEKKSPLLDLAIVRAPPERAAILALFLMGSVEAGIVFAVPLYIQIVQGRDAFQTAMVTLPFMFAFFAAAFLIVRQFSRFTPRQIASVAILLVAAGSFWLAWVVRNDWNTVPMVVGLGLTGLGQGALATLLLNVLVSASPKELAGDVGALRAATNNLSASVGTALMGALLVGVLSANVMTYVSASPVITAELRDQLDLDSINFVSNDRLVERLARTTATPEQVAEAVRINESTRLRSLKIAFVALGAVSLLSIFPASRLPRYKPGEVPSESGRLSR